MLKRLFFVLVILATSSISNLLIAKEYFIQMKKGWQLIGLPSDIENMRPFNNQHVKIVWGFDGKYKEWIGYSPDSEIRNRLNNKNINQLTQIKRWQGLWVFSYDDWDLKVDDETILYSLSPEVTSVKLYHGWNLISLPFNTTISAKMFERYKIWKYAVNSTNQYEWQTNQSLSLFNLMEDINSKEGFWIYSPDKDEVNLDFRVELSKMLINIDETIGGTTTSKFDSLDEVENFIKQEMVVSSRKKEYWNWNIVNPETVTRDPFVQNSLTNSVAPNIKTEEFKQLQFVNKYLFYIYNDHTIHFIHIDDLLYSSTKSPYALTIAPSFGHSKIEKFYVVGNKLVVVSSLNADGANLNFAGKCRKKQTFISMYEIDDNNPTANLKAKSIFIDGDFQAGKIIDTNLYVVTKFNPCIELDYKKVFLSDLDECNYPPFDTLDYQNRCYDVLVDSDTDLRFRYDFSVPEIMNYYALPKYELNGVRNELIDSENFYTTAKLDQNSSIYTLSHISLTSGNLEKRDAIYGNFKNIYFSEKNLYFFSEEYSKYFGFNDYRKFTNIIKFSFYPTIEYRASGEIQGEIPSQYSIYEDSATQNLRVGARDFISWENFNKDTYSNRISILKQNDFKLDEVGKLSDMINYQYQLAGLKFYGDIAIASPNSSQEPFQLIKFDENTPIKAGTFKINNRGTSDFVYYDNERKQLISVGREITETNIKGGIQIDLIDIKNPQKPKTLHSKYLGDYFNNTPVNTDSQSFGYFDKNLIIPVYSNGGKTEQSSKSGLALFQIKDLFVDGEKTSKIETNNYVSGSLINDSTITPFANFVRTEYYNKYLIYLINGKISFKRIEQ